MENMSDKQDKYGNVTFGEATKLLISTIGQNVTLDLAGEKGRKALKKRQERMYSEDTVYSAKNETADVYHNLVSSETEEAKGYYVQFFKDVERKYGFSAFAKQIFADFTGCFFYALADSLPFEKPKRDIALFLLKKQTFHYIYNSITEGIGKKDIFKPSRDGVLLFFTDSYKKIFDEIKNDIPPGSSSRGKKGGFEALLNAIFGDKKHLHEKIEIYFNDNAEVNKYHQQESPDFRQSIHNWSSGGHNPTWSSLKPFLDFLCEEGKTLLAHRLISLYLRKNAQKALVGVLEISKEEQEEIILDIVSMIKENKDPKEFYEDIYAGDLQFDEQITLISMYLSYQNYTERFDPIISNNIMKHIEAKCPKSSEKFFSPWLKTRAKIFELHSTLKNDKNTKEEILTNYKKAFENGIAYAGSFLAQFLVEGIVINNYFNPRREKDAKDFFGYGYVLDVFRNDKQELLRWIEEETNNSNDIKSSFIEIHHRFNAAISYALINEKDTEKEINGTATQKGEQSEREKVSNIMQKHTLHSFQLNLLVEPPDPHILFNKAIAWNDRGLEYKREDLFLGALLCFSQAIMMKPHCVDVYINRGQILAEYHEKYNRTTQDWQTIAFSNYDIALLLEPKNEVALFNRARLFQITEQHKKAIDDLSRLVEINPKNFKAYAMLGDCYFGMRDINKAEEYSIKAITINPDFAEGHRNLGTVYKILGNSKKAMFHNNTAMKIDPDLDKKLTLV